MAALRAEQADIASALGVSVPTLRKYFAEELATRIAADNLFTAESAALPLQPAPVRPVRREKRSDGRKRWEPMRHERDQALVLIANNVRQSVIAARLGVTLPTFRRAFREDLDTASETVRAELLVQMAKTARSGNITAQRHLYELTERAALERIDEAVKGRAPEAAVKALGKKEQATVDAGAVEDDPEWRDLLKPAAAPRPPLN